MHFETPNADFRTQEGWECRLDGISRRAAGRDAVQIELLERRQRAAVERSDKGGAAGVGDLCAPEVQPPELRQHSRRRRQRTCRRRRRQEGGEALVAERVAVAKDQSSQGGRVQVQQSTMCESPTKVTASRRGGRHRAASRRASDWLSKPRGLTAGVDSLIALESLIGIGGPRHPSSPGATMGR